MITLQSIQKNYGPYAVLTIPSFTFNAGINLIKGVNGSGKTTLFKLMAGLLPFEGDVVINKTTSIKQNPIAYRSIVNYGEAEPLYPPFLTGTDLVNLFSESKRGDKQQTHQLITHLKIDSFVNNAIGTYSSGMLKKLSIVLAFIGQPKVILLDEPLITIDDASVPLIYELILDYHRNKGVTFLLSSHHGFDSGLFAPNTFIVRDKTISALTE